MNKNNEPAKAIRCNKKINLFNLRILCLCLTTIFLMACNNEIAKPIPFKIEEQSQGAYDKYLNLLKKAYKDNDNFEAALQLSNLKAKPSVTYDLLNYSINEDQSNCDQIYEWYYLYDRHNFGVNLLKLDTLKFKEAVNLCDKLSSNTSYENYVKLKDEEERLMKQNREVEDSTNFNRTLVTELEKIRFDDQEIRNRSSAKGISPEEKQKLLEEMYVIDSINLQKIEKIFMEHGYPRKELVGKEGNFTPALVIHHSSSLETRYKHLPLLEKAVEVGILGRGTLNMINKRIKDMELDEPKK